MPKSHFGRLAQTEIWPGTLGTTFSCRIPSLCRSGALVLPDRVMVPFDLVSIPFDVPVVFSQQFTPTNRIDGCCLFSNLTPPLPIFARSWRDRQFANTCTSLRRSINTAVCRCRLKRPLKLYCQTHGPTRFAEEEQLTSPVALTIYLNPLAIVAVDKV